MASGLRWTSEEYEKAQARARFAEHVPAILPDVFRVKALPIVAPKAKGKLATRKMNKTEAQYAERLKSCPDVIWWEFEGITLRLGNDCRYTADFAVMLADGSIELHETKGFMRDDALVKLKVAAASYPFKVILVRYAKGVWSSDEIQG